MKKIVLFSLLLLSFAITATAQVTEHTYKTIDLQNYGTVSIGTIIDLTKKRIYER
jgi:Skp family chaperone for outer membrane proteins